ncbi:MAG: ABC transporter substrate-binding protein [Desulfuromonadales bacterium]|nr:ABC transporter substrate-binding protein [Desulfuromonadales bacterium]
MSRKRSIAFLTALFLMFICLFSRSGEAAPYKVLVVMSYHESYPWGMEIKEGIDAELAGISTLKYVYLDTKNNSGGGAEKAKKFYDLYREFRPDGVIAADDAAQSLFVVPYLKNKVPTPVMFCGVNEEPDVYGYPATNVSGVLERVHIKESLAFLQQLSPSVKSFGCIMKNDPSSRGILTQIHQESVSYSARFVEARFPGTLVEALAMVKKMKTKCDALFLTPLDGLKGAHGEALTTQDVTPVLVRAFGKPTTSENSFNVRSGVLCAVIKTGQEQGSTAAKMLLKAMGGTPVKELPITRNQYGKRMINVSVMNRLKIKPKPYFLIDTEFVGEEK